MDWRAAVGFARRANKLTIGREATLRALRKGRLSLIILATDAGEAIKREIMKVSEKYSIRTVLLGFKRELGKIVGKESCSVLGLTDSRMAQGVIDFEQNKGLRVSENNRPFDEGANGEVKRPWCGGKNAYEYDRYRDS